jgi:outer membrane receptor protein involved in Fe transport/translation initiation factor IF-1
MITFFNVVVSNVMTNTILVMKNIRPFIIASLILTLNFSNLFSGTIDPTKGIIRGKIIDASSNEPMEFATVTIYTQDSVLVTGNISASDGKFNIEVPEGDYDVIVQFISYQNKKIEDISISRDEKEIELGEIGLLPDTELLSEAVVTAEKSEMVIGLDRKIFNIGKDLGNSGKSASEILDNIPSVTVDLDGNVSLRGSQGVQILIDGKPSSLASAGNTDALRSLQGSLIEKIEVVTNPSARYEAAGMAGIINIVLKKEQKEGVNGSFEVSAGYPHDYKLGANVNFRRSKLNYFLNYGVDYDERPGEGMANQFFMFPDTSYRTNLARDRLRTGWSQNLRGGADYFINERSTLTAAVFLGISDEDNATSIWYRDYDQLGEMQQVTLRQDNEKELERNIEFSLNYDLKFDQKDRKFNAFIQYIEEGETEDSDVKEIISELYGEKIEDSNPVIQEVLNKESEKELRMQADYIHPIGDEGRFEAGYRSDLRFIKNPYEVKEQDEFGNMIFLEDYTNDFDYSENIHALYTQAGNKFNKWSLLLGLRTELSDVRTYLQNTDERNNRLYFDIFPTAHTSYEIDEKNSLQISYSRRINRPNFWNLNPFNNYTDARNIRTGNPNLDPEYTDSYEMGYLFTNGKTTFYSGGYLRDTDGVIERISEVDEQGVTYIIPYNLSERQSFGVESNVSVDPFEWWTLSGDINAYRAITSGDYEGEKLENDTYSWNTRLNSMMRFKSRDLDIQTTFFYRAPRETTQGELKAYYMMNMGISKDILEGNGTLTLNVRDVLNTRNFRYVIDRENLYSENEFRWSTRSVSLSFVYRLNQKKKMNRGGGGGFGGGEMGI